MAIFKVSMWVMIADALHSSEQSDPNPSRELWIYLRCYVRFSTPTILDWTCFNCLCFLSDWMRRKAFPKPRPAPYAIKLHCETAIVISQLCLCVRRNETCSVSKAYCSSYNEKKRRGDTPCTPIPRPLQPPHHVSRYRRGLYYLSSWR